MDYKDLDQAVLGGFSDFDNHYKVRFFTDDQTGLKACVAVHNINIGPGLGGCRMYPYGSDEDGIRDVLRLSRGMTYKNALAGLPLGGGKSVIFGDSHKMKSDDLIEAMGRAVHTLGGDYVSAEDSGTNEHDMAVMRRATPFVMGQKVAEQGALGGDPSPVTAHGVFCGMRAVLRHKFKTDDMKGMIFAVQGLGAVGYDLCRRLHEAGGKLVVTDVRAATLEKVQAEFPDACVVAPDEIFDAEADVFVPCALGAQINEDTIARFKVGVIAGAANNQMATEEDHERLADRDILYAPDYAINSGGVIAVGYEFFAQEQQNPFAHDLTRETMMTHVAKIEDTIDEILDVSAQCGMTPGRAADDMAEAIFNGGPVRETSMGTI